MSKNYPVAEEVALSEFERFADMMGLDVDPEGMNEEEKANFKKLKNKIIIAIQKNALVINENGEAVYTPQRTQGVNPLTFHELNGAYLQAQDRRKQGEDVAKMFVIMEQLTKSAPGTFAKMKAIDLSVCMAVANLFLAEL